MNGAVVGIRQNPTSQVLCYQLQLIKYLRESRELKPFQDFVEYLLGGGLVNPMVVLIRVLMEIVVLQQQMFASQPTGCTHKLASNTKGVAKIL